MHKSAVLLLAFFGFCAAAQVSVRAQTLPSPSPPGEVATSAPPDSTGPDAESSPAPDHRPLEAVDAAAPAATAAPDSSRLRSPVDDTLTSSAAEPMPKRSRTRVLKWMYQDVGALASHVATPKFALYAGGALAFTFGLAWLDDDAVQLVHDANKGFVEDFFLVVDTLGGPIINVPVVAAAGISLLTNNERFQDAAWTSLQTLAYAGVLGYVLKGIFGRDRPIWTDDPYAFFSRTGKNPVVAEGNSSFPSGHAISSFGIITPWVLYYPNPFTYALYIIPIGTTVSRLAHDRHWGTDIVVGAAIGVAMGRFLTARHKRERLGEPPPRLDLSLAPHGPGLRLIYRLD